MTHQDTLHDVLATDASAAARHQRRPLIRRIRFQLGGALLLSALTPFFLGGAIGPLHLEHVSSEVEINSAIADTIAITAGYGILRRLMTFPGTKAAVYMLPSLALSFALVALFLAAARIDYSFARFTLGFILSFAWLHAVFFLCNRFAVPQFAIMPGGNHRSVTGIGGVTWRRLTSPPDGLNGIDAVVADLHADLSPAWQRFIARCVLAGIPVKDVKNVIESLTGRVDVEHWSESSFGAVLPSRLYMRLKRLLDLLLALVLVLPFLAMIAAAAIFIRLESPGPVFFRQPRMGYGGQIFTIYKLRSMKAGNAETARQFTEAGDPRITRVGRFIRKYRIDELPQIVNIVRGEMSWIGPRPEAIALAAWYAKDIPFYIYRHAVRPGLSGWAQVHQGNVAEVDAATVKLQYDFYYIKHFSPWLEVLVIFKTVRTILTGFGSL